MPAEYTKLSFGQKTVSRKEKRTLSLSFILMAVFTASVCIGLYLLLGSEKKGIIPIIIGLTALAGAVITIISRRQSITEYYEILNLTGPWISTIYTGFSTN